MCRICLCVICKAGLMAAAVGRSYWPGSRAVTKGSDAETCFALTRLPMTRLPRISTLR